ncbi:hypothetical protein C8Q79DRAFT_138064 [Trametes meyenii]|nr:hypothetical protein C8Q79DRAFT_138064 [Trametes meyenii]
MSEAQFTHWLSVTDATLTFVGGDFNDSIPLSRRAAQITTVTYCTKRVGNTCGGECTVYKGGAACVDTSKIQCLAANKNVGFCDKKGCDGNCRTLSACGTFLEDGFCYAAETQSIVVSTL